MNIGTAAKESGLTPDAIRFYERRAIVPSAQRAANGYREYTDRHVASLRLAKGLRDLGVALPEVAAIVRMAHDATCSELRDAMAASVDGTLRELDVRLRALRQTKHELAKLRAGLGEMVPPQAELPGITACECVRLVRQGEGKAQRKQRRSPSGRRISA